MPCPVSASQRRIWFLEQLSPGTFANNILVAYDVAGTLDLERLASAVRHVAARHEVLRTRFVVADGQPAQVVDETLPLVPLDVLDAPRGIEEAILLESRRPLCLESGPVFRISLFRQQGTDAQVLLLNLHHIVSDGNHSAAVFMRELVASYAGADSGPRPPLRYRDFASWQNARCQGPDFAARLDDYARSIGDAPTVLELPFSAHRPDEQTFEGSSVWTTLKSSLLREARELGSSTGGSLLTVLTATFQALLHLYTRQTAVLVAVPVSGRNLEGTEGLVGYFGNPVVHRLDFEPGESFRDLLRRSAKRFELARGYSDVPFDDLVRRLDPVRDAGRSPIFQFLVEVQAALPRLEAPGVTFAPREIQTGIAPYDLLLSVTESPDHALARFDYNDRLFDGETVARVAEHFMALLRAAVARPDSRPVEACLPDTQELRRVLRDFGVRPAPGSDLPCVHRIVEEGAAKFGDATAIELEGERLGYRELNARANRLARCLVVKGVGPERVAGILMNRSIDAVVALVAICKTGGAFVALDPELPADRLTFLLADSKAVVVLSEEGLAGKLQGQPVDVLCPDRDRELIAAQDAADLPDTARADSLAYLIYTSGSTGRPKAIAMRHGCLSNLVAWQARHPQLSQRARTLQFAPFHFDIAYQELFTTWHAGGTLVLVPQPIRRDVEALLDYLARHRIERLYLPYAALENLARVFRPQGSHGLCLREIITAGEQLTMTPALVRLLEALPECRLYNQYGPSEAHVVTLHELVGSPSTWPAQPPIGRPIDGTQIYLLNEALVPVPIGVPGEVFLGGAGLARGYLGRADLTADKFVPDLFSEQPGARLYRTGDLARYLPDGALQFLGRVDDQVKIRGFRVEPGEVEALLREHPSVMQAVVLAERSGQAGARLFAYAVPMPGAALDRADLAADLRDHLERKLPEYMVPASLFVIDEIPLKVTGKIDRAALSRLGASATPAEARGYSPPATPMQISIAAIWCSVLGLPRVGENDHFFKLGGHSLLATQVVSALRTSLGVAVPLAAVFQRPTLAELSAYVEAASGAPARAASADGDRQANIPVAAPFVEERADLEMGEL